MPKIVNLVQGSPEWHNWRLAHIGGSDSNLIGAYFLDTDYPYTNSWAGADLYRLWAVKVGRIIEKEAKDQSWGDYKDPLVHGKETEEVARNWYMMETGELAPAVCLEHDEIPYLGASLDGWTGERGVEIKCPTEPETHLQAKDGGVIPDRWYCQMQHNLFVSGAPVLDYVSFYKGEGIITEIEADPDFAPKLREAEDLFWSWVEAKQFPLPTGEAKDDSQLWETLVSEYFKAQQMQRKADEWQRKVKVQMARAMMAAGGAAKIIGGGATVSLRVRAKSEVKAFTKDEGLMLDVRRA